MNSAETILIFGANGALGSALISQAKKRFPNASIYAVSRRSVQNFDGQLFTCDPSDEDQLSLLAYQLSELRFDRIIVATGLLHTDNLYPEKRYSDLNKTSMSQLFFVNTIIPSLIAKHFLPLLPVKTPSVFAVLSARVGSITDNRLGGWYSYRASKAALNMIIKSLSIEVSRRHKQAIILGLHPGTVRSDLSEPYLSSSKTVFSPDQSANYLWDVIEDRRVSDTGFCFDWKGDKIDA